MYSGVIAHGGPHEATGIAASLYFVLLVILGNCILESKEVQSLLSIIFNYNLARSERSFFVSNSSFCRFL